MNQEQHKAEAERLLDLAGEVDDADSSRDLLVMTLRLQGAQVHASLATIPDRPTSSRWPSCRCPQYRAAHIWGAGCPAEVIADPMVGATPMPAPAPRLPVPDEPMCVCGATGVRAHDRRTTKGCRMRPAPVSDGPGS